MSQLLLPFPLEPSARFETFVAGKNAALVAHLRSLSETGNTNSPPLWLWGEPSCGKSHLLQATCAAMPPASTIYLPLKDLPKLVPDVLHGLESLDLVVLDDLDVVVGNPAWEQMLFSLFNGLQAEEGRLVCAARCAPAGLKFFLPDLDSRASGAIIYQVTGLIDDHLVIALQTHARFRGIDLPDKSARFLLHRLPRDMGGLCRWLDTLDQASLAVHRKLTVPFIREVLGMSDS